MVQGRPMRIGLTGGVGAGKSTVLRLLAQKGIPTLQTDQVTHRLLEDKKVRSKLRGLFGRGIFSSGGKVDRKALGKVVFQDPKMRNRLNRLLHPLVRKEVSLWAKNRSEQKPVPSLLIVEVPLLFEGGFYRWFDRALSVSAPNPLRQERLIKRGWGPSEVRQRENSQWPQESKDRQADWVIFNRGSIKSLKYSVNEWFKKVQTGTMRKTRTISR